MLLNTLTAISPIDGRYRNKTEDLAAYFSEYGLIKYRTLVEIEYFIALCQIPLPALADFPNAKFDTLKKIVTDFTEADAQKIKDIEKITNHDVKAVEYFLKEKFDALGLHQWKELTPYAQGSGMNDDTVMQGVEKALRKYFGKRGEQVIQDNLTCVRRGFTELKEVPGAVVRS